MQQHTATLGNQAQHVLVLSSFTIMTLVTITKNRQVSIRTEQDKMLKYFLIFECPLHSYHCIMGNY